MNYYLIDYENVKTHGLDGIGKLKEEDTICIFYSENADSITFGLHKRINEAKATILYQKVDVGRKNALDFQLASYLGYIIHENNNKEISYFIVTKDMGFSSLVSYWEKRKIDIYTVIDVSGRDEQKAQKELRNDIEKIIDEKEIVDTVICFIEQYKTKQGIHNALIKKYSGKDNRKASEIYKLIKPLIADKK